VLSGSGSERELTQRPGRIFRPTGGDVSDAERGAGATGDGETGSTRNGGAGATRQVGRALLYELVTAETAEEDVAGRRR